MANVRVATVNYLPQLGKGTEMEKVRCY